MAKRILYAMSAFALTTCLTVAKPSSALGASNRLKCEVVFAVKRKAAFTSITHFVSKTGVMIRSSEFREGTKTIYLTPEDSWSRGENAQHLFRFSMRVESNEEAHRFFSQLVQQINSAHGTQLTVISQRENVFEVPGLFKAGVHVPSAARQIPMTQGQLEIEISIPKSANELVAAKLLGSTLLQAYNLRWAPTNLRHLSTYDLSTREGRAAWGYEAFFEWLSGLSADARDLLKSISGPDYQYILPVLRGQQQLSGQSAQKLQNQVAELDAAINRGKLPLPVKLYRATTDVFTLNAWTQLMADSKAQVQQLSDTAYTFTSLDEDFVQSWNDYELNGKGIVIEIEASAGLRAGYVARDSRDRDYAEIILARGQRLTPVRAYTTASGERRLVVTAQ